MKRLLLVFLPILALSGCAGLGALMAGPIPAPAAVADKTVIDEQAAIGVELAYQASAQLIVTANMAGLLDAPMKARLRDLDNRAYRAVLSTRAAYRAGNAPDYFAASGEARAAISDILAAVKGS